MVRLVSRFHSQIMGEEAVQTLGSAFAIHIGPGRGFRAVRMDEK